YGQRFILRRQSPALTIGGGVILDPGIEPRRRVTDLQAAGAALDTPDEVERLSAYLAEQDKVTAAPLTAAWKVGVPPSRHAIAVGSLMARNKLVVVGTAELPRPSVRRLDKADSESGSVS